MKKNKGHLRIVKEGETPTASLPPASRFQKFLNDSDILKGATLTLLNSYLLYFCWGHAIGPLFFGNSITYFQSILLIITMRIINYALIGTNTTNYNLDLRMSSDYDDTEDENS